MQNRIARIVVLSMSLASAATARAGIIGFNPATYTYNQGDAGSPPVIGPDSIQITTGNDQRRSLWFNAPQDITSFTATFTYRASSITASALRQGVAFVIQDSPAGTAALGTTFGYEGVPNSVAVTIETDTGPGLTYSGVYTNGTLGGGSAATSPVNAFNFNDIDVTITYDGSVLSVLMVDGADTYGPINHLVGNLSSTIGSPTAYVGFTASTFNFLGGGGGANQHLSNVRFNAVPEPSTLALLAVGAFGLAALAVRRNRRHR